MTPGWATFGQVVPQGVAFDGLQIGDLPTQTDVKNRWPDGSIRFAVVTTKVLAGGSYPMVSGPALSGGIAPTSGNVSATLTISGMPYTATMPSTPTADAWLSGPLVSEGRFVVAPIPGKGALVPHPFLRVIFDMRSYADGSGRADVTVENVLDLEGANTVSYTAVIRVNGTPVFTKLNVEHFYLTRWRKTFGFGATPTADVIPDITPFNTARALPPYLSLVPDQVDLILPGDPGYEILGPGSLNPDMPAHGGNPDLAPFPDWAARYLVHPGNTEQRRFVLAHGDLSGSWPVHVREPEAGSTTGVGATERLVSLDQRPAVWYDERVEWDFSTLPDGTPLDKIKGMPLPYKEYTGLCQLTPPGDQELLDGCTPLGTGHTRLIPDTAHQPSLAYIPYLLTGDRYYAEEMAFWANYNMLRTYPADGLRGTGGVLDNNEVRGYGWALRNLVDAAAYYPDASAVKAYLAEKVTANLQHLDAYATAELAKPENPLKFLWIGKRPEPGYISLWEQTYLAYAIDRAQAQGFVGGTTHRDAIANLQLRLFTSAPDYPRSTELLIDTQIDNYDPPTVLPAGTVLQWSAPYLVGVGTPGSCFNSWEPDVTYPCWDTFTYHQTLQDVFASTNSFDLQRDFAGYYGPEARLNLMMLLASGHPEAQEPYDYLYPYVATNNSYCAESYGGTGNADRPDLACRAGWALDFYPSYAPPAGIDTDGDGIVDGADADDDNDGVLDGNDAFPLDA
ncbi:MAG: hypothetical protein ABI665_23705, partial [Vicinamibacterales bacterium]